MKWLKNLLASWSIGMMNALGPTRRATDPTAEYHGQEEPEREQDAWDSFMHHDDVTAHEIHMLTSGDPVLILQAEKQIFQRTAEFMEIWNNPEKRRELFYTRLREDKSAYYTDMGKRLGWESDDMPETFYARDELTGELIEVPYSEEDGW